MHHGLKLLGLVALVNASPFPDPQAVTAKIFPPEPRPSDCELSYHGKFGFSIMPLKRNAKRTENTPPSLTAIIASLDTDSVVAIAARKYDESVDRHDGDSVTIVLPCSGECTERPVEYPTNEPAIYYPLTLVTEYWDGQPQAPRETDPIGMTPSIVSQSPDGQAWVPSYSGDESPGKPMVTSYPECTRSHECSGGGYGRDSECTGIEYLLGKLCSQADCHSGQQPCPPKVPGTSQYHSSDEPNVRQSQDGQPIMPAPEVTANVGQSVDGQPTAAAHSSKENIHKKLPREGGASYFKDIDGNQACSPNALTMNLKDGVLKDQLDRTAYIANNFQFQFDGPPQHGALTTAGYSVCKDGAMALGGTKVFWRCPSGDFYNLYDRDWASHCEPVHMMVVPLDACD